MRASAAVLCLLWAIILVLSPFDVHAGPRAIQQACPTAKSNSDYLAAAEEKPLWCGAETGDVTYRFLWLRSFGPPLVVRVTRMSDVVALSAVELLGTGSHEPEPVARRQSLPLTVADWTRLAGALSVAQFWDARTRLDVRPVHDGAQWIFEGRRGDTYHGVVRWSQEPEDAFYKLGLLFLDLAGWSDSVGPVY